VLAPLGLDDVGRLAAGALHCDLNRARPLSQLVYEKTGGNPFFAIQFLTELAEEGLLAFDPAAQAWRWEIDRIHARGYTDNVVDLMVEKLKRLAPRAREAMKLLACLGHVAEITTLTLGHEETEEAMDATLREAVHAGLIDRPDGAYRFLHDRIQQAAYSLIPDERRAEIHLQIGRALLANMTAEQIAEHLFDVANQLNRGVALLVDRDEKTKVATIDLRAGRKAKASAAYASAGAYFSAGTALLDEGDWESQYELTFNLWLERAECELLTGHFDEADPLIGELLQRAASKVDEAAVYHLKVQFHIMKSDHQQAVATALTCLRQLGIDLPARPSQEQVRAEYETVWQILNGRQIESLIDLPLMTDPELQAAMQVMSVLYAPAYFTDFRLCCLMLCRMAQVSLLHGMSAPSAAAYGFWGSVVLAGLFHRYGEAYRFCKLACDLVERHGFIASQPKVYVSMGAVAYWRQPIAASIDFLQRGFRAAIETGDPAYACFSLFMSVAFRLLRNDPLDEVGREAEMALDFIRKTRFGDTADTIVNQQRFIATMQGRTATFSSFSDAGFDEATFEARFTGHRMPMMISYWVLKLKARFLSGDYAEALAAADRTEALLPDAASQYLLLDYVYYGALTLAALYESAATDQQNKWHEVLTTRLQQLGEWAENYPPTFGDKYALVSAEIARIEGRELDAERLYEQAIRSARDNGFVQNEGVAHEVAARFYAARGFEAFANTYLRNARYCYLRWGAGGKVRQLDRLYPHLAAPEEKRAGAAVGSAIQQLDVASVVKASQALSSEIVLPKLIERLMKIAIENAGADRGLLILPSGDEYLIEAEARATGDQVEVTMRHEPITRIDCPESLVRYVIRTQESVILDDASKPSLFSADDYLRDRQSKSILCLPLIKQQQLTGVLLLENALASHAFTPARLAVLELLAAQAAISLENTRLYGDLQEREAKVRRLVDSNIIGICIFDLDGRLMEANDAFLRIVGYSRDDLISGRLRWTDLTPPEWSGAAERALAEIASTGTCRPYEKEYLRKDGSRVPVLMAGANFGELRHQGVAFALDLSDRKRAEAELAHANRVATMGQLTASIAHEVNQPLAALLTNAGTAARWLARQPPNSEKAKPLIDRIISDGKRAADIVSRIRDFSRKAPARKGDLEINETILDIVRLTRAAMSEHGVLVKMQLPEGLPQILGDRVQLQQVILNLIMNAIEAMSEVKEGSRELLISTSEVEPGSVLVAVSDSGPGLPPESLARIFEPFYTTKSSGLGMGLSICRSIVEAHGGRLWATPNQPHGAVFCMMLPIGEKSFEKLESSEA
jgi:PAS domain S-box-containing protein